MRSTKSLVSTLSVVAAATLLLTAAAGIAAAEPDTAESRIQTLWVHSDAMGRDIEVEVRRAADTSQPVPVLYLLGGAGGGVGAVNWQTATDAMDFLAGKNVTVVAPIGGDYTYYTDWREPDPVLGVNKWRTFLTQELPPVVDRELNGNGRNAIAGLSMAGTSVLQLAIAAPGLYRSVASYSGCAQISDPLGHAFVSMVVTKGGGDPANMYGPEGDPEWAANDPFLHADQLRGLNLFISSGSGLPGRWDLPGGPHTLPGLDGWVDQLSLGGTIEAATNYCSHHLAARLDWLGIPATYDFTLTGTHSWGYWQEAVKQSWPVLAAGLGLPA
ncbi:alpha/beta hydrolase [Nocardia tengchongensis]|uniref:alpha/beta hydrolase n=1 Tax=Nocardia tengchongensis TaxID=2055889 RepID=UPI00369F2253